MGVGRVLRFAGRIGVLLVALAVIYVGVTFVQVYSASQRDRSPDADAIIVLGAAQYDGRPSPVLRGRLDHALELYADGIAPVVVVTGGKQPGDAHTEAEAGYTYLRQNGGVPDEAILREEQGRNTWESLAASYRFLEPQGIVDVVLVTDGYHAFRVHAVAQDLGFEAYVSPSREGGTPRDLAKETVAVAVGRVIGFDRLVNLDHAVTE